MAHVEPKDELKAGRRAQTFVMTPEWVLCAGLSPQAQALYTQLLAHVNRQRGDGLAWPGMKTLAELMGYSKRQSVSKYLQELADLGAIDVEAKKYALGRRNVYTVHEMPPPGYLGPMSLSAFYATKRQVTDGWSAVGDHGSSAVGDHGWSAVGDKNQTKNNQTKKNLLGHADARPSETATQDDIEAIVDTVQDEYGFRHWVDGMVQGMVMDDRYTRDHILNAVRKKAREEDEFIAQVEAMTKVKRSPVTH